MSERRSQLQRVVELAHVAAFGWGLVLIAAGVPIAYLAGSVRFDVVLGVCFAVTLGCCVVLGRLDQP